MHADDWPLAEIEEDLLVVLDCYETAETDQKIAATLSLAARMIEAVAQELSRKESGSCPATLKAMSQYLHHVRERFDDGIDTPTTCGTATRE